MTGWPCDSCQVGMRQGREEQLQRPRVGACVMCWRDRRQAEGGQGEVTRAGVLREGLPILLEARCLRPPAALLSLHTMESLPPAAQGSPLPQPAAPGG